MQKIMFVCTGNICRSPLAHAVFAHKAAERGVADQYQLESSGLTAYHVGDNADPRMRRTAAQRGVNLDHMARRFMPRDLEHYDLVLAMDQGHFSDMRRMAADDNERAKIRMFREFDPEARDGAEVPDPYYGGARGFDDVYDIVERTTETLLDALERVRREGGSL